MLPDLENGTSDHVSRQGRESARAPLQLVLIANCCNLLTTVVCVILAADVPREAREKSQSVGHCTVLSKRRRQDVGCLTFQQHTSVSQGRICTDSGTCCHTQIEVAFQTFYLNQSQNTDIGPTNPGDDPIMPNAWQGSHCCTNV